MRKNQRGISYLVIALFIIIILLVSFLVYKNKNVIMFWMKTDNMAQTISDKGSDVSEEFRKLQERISVLEKENAQLRESLSTQEGNIKAMFLQKHQDDLKKLFTKMPEK